MTPEKRTHQIVAELERRARWARPFLVIGMLALVGSLVGSAIYLNVLLSNAEKRERQWKAKASELDVTLQATGIAVQRRDLDTAAKLLKVALAQTDDLATVAAESAPPPILEPPASRPKRTTRSGNGAKGQPGDRSPPQDARTAQPIDDAPPATPIRSSSAAPRTLLTNRTPQNLSCSPVATGQPMMLAPGAALSVPAGDYTCLPPVRDGVFRLRAGTTYVLYPRSGTIQMTEVTDE